jgi:hypothetical protein
MGNHFWFLDHVLLIGQIAIVTIQCRQVEEKDYRGADVRDVLFIIYHIVQRSFC